MMGGMDHQNPLQYVGIVLLTDMLLLSCASSYLLPSMPHSDTMSSLRLEGVAGKPLYRTASICFVHWYKFDGLNQLVPW